MPEPSQSVYLKRYMAHLRNAFSSQVFQEDALGIAELRAQEVAGISRALAEFSDFLDEKRLRALINPYIEDEPSQESAARFIRNFSQYHHASKADLSTFIERCEALLQEVLVEKAADFPIDAFLNHFRQLVRHSPGLARQLKAERLADETGNEVDSLTIICDMRPMFDASRKSIEGIVLLSTLKFEFQEDYHAKSIEFRLSRSDLSRLKEEASTALAKLDALHTLCDRVDLKVANVEGE